MSNLVGKNILIVDEVDDTRTTLEYAVRELKKDIETARQNMGGGAETRFSIFVLHVSVTEISLLFFFRVIPWGWEQGWSRERKWKWNGMEWNGTG